MQHKKLRRILKRYGRRVRAVQGKHRDENILKLMEMEKGRQEFVKFPAFARGQIGMIGKYSLLWYVIWLVLFVWGLNGDGMNVLGGHRNEILLSVMPPFCCFLRRRIFPGCSPTAWWSWRKPQSLLRSMWLWYISFP